MRISDWSSDLCSSYLLARIFARHRVGAVMHFAGAIVVPESMAAPLTYYLTNTCKTRSLLQSCVDQGITRFVFSSTAAVYGEPDEVPVGEAAPTRPASPDGASKLMVKWMLLDVDRPHGLRNVILSYFNVVGADPPGRTWPVIPDAPHPITEARQEAPGPGPGLETL